MKGPKLPRRALLSGGFLLFSSPAFGGEPNWPQFRGPEANPIGSSTGLPDRWSTTDNVEWSAEIPGRGWSSPVVAGGKVFVTTVTTDGRSKQPQTGVDFSNDYVAELTKQGLSGEEVMKRVYARDIEMPGEVTVHYLLYCLDLETGKVIWRKEFHSGHPPSGRHRKNSFASETPVTDGERLYVYVGNHGLYAFDLEGKQLWHTPLATQKIYLDFGTGGSPAIHGDQIFVLSDNEEQQYIASFHRKTGKQLWRTDREIGKRGGDSRRSGWTTPYVWTNEVRTELVTVGPGLAISYDLQGKELWRLSNMTASPIPSPFAYQGLLFIDGGAGRPVYAVRPGASGDISLGKDESANEYVAWSAQRAGTYLPTPVAYDGGLYVLTEKGILSRFDAKTGKLTYKARIHPEAGAFTSSPWAYGGKIFCISEEGNTYVAAAGDTFQLLHVNPLGEMAQATPAIVGDRLLVRTEGHLYSLRGKPASKAR